ncbi:hypothetical protein ElyMa_002208500 [Elysia marginata]|uniref:Uncharacterized protein n=1 Tax=Elysia marginata TaxID=1093978 RepID=A0AAV4FTT5_9GAST|nr:hypothetical protein ElyMa_002208500 [Elysia marginata]
MPFLGSELEYCLRTLLERVVKSETLENANTPLKLVALDLKETDILLPADSVGVGFKIKRVLKSSSASPKDFIQLKMEARNFVVAMVKKLQEKSPLNSKLVRNINWMIP